MSISSYGYTIELLPILGANEAKPLTPFRLLKEKGESALCPVENVGLIAYLEFPADGKPRGNHFHKMKNEYIYLAKGKLRGFFRPAGRSELPIEEVEIGTGSLIMIPPRCSHTFIALEDGHAIEWSSEKWEVVRDDSYDDVLV